jgi:hypothetical protein
VTFCSTARRCGVVELPSQTLPSNRPLRVDQNLIGESEFCFVHSINASSTSSGEAPSKTGVATALRLPPLMT